MTNTIYLFAQIYNNLFSQNINLKTDYFTTLYFQFWYKTVK